jgi:Fic family protein
MNTIWNKLNKLIAEYRSLNLENAIDFKKFNLYSLVHHSATLEGCTLTEAETQVLLDKGLTANGKPLEHSLMVKDCYHAFLYVIAESKKKTKLSPEFLKEINSMVMKSTGGIYQHALGNFDSSKGDYRLAPAFAQGGNYYLSAEKIPAYTTKFCNEINNRLDKMKNIEEQYKLSFDVHFNLVSIHPWGDGNGRTCRLAMNYVQLYFNLPLTKVYFADRLPYIEALQATRDKENITIFHDFMCSQQIKFFEEKIKEYKRSQNKTNGMTLLF